MKLNKTSFIVLYALSCTFLSNGSGTPTLRRAYSPYPQSGCELAETFKALPERLTPTPESPSFTAELSISPESSILTTPVSPTSPALISQQRYSAEYIETIEAIEEVKKKIEEIKKKIKKERNKERKKERK